MVFTHGTCASWWSHKDGVAAVPYTLTTTVKCPARVKITRETLMEEREEGMEGGEKQYGAK